MGQANCYSDVPNKADIFGQLAKAHAMIAHADDLLFDGERPAAHVAILYPRSSFLWDGWGSAGGPVCMCCCTSSMVAHNNDYTVETYGIYLALTTDSNVLVEFIDEDALLEPERLAKYKLIVVTQPNVPAAGQTQLLQWATQSGGTLLTTSNAASADEYNAPSTTISDTMGIQEINRGRRTFLSETADVVAGRGSVKLSATSSDPPIPFVAVGVRGALKLSGSGHAKATPRVLGRFSDREPALVETTVGRGTLVRFAYMPGVSYWFNKRDPSTRSLLVQLAQRAGAVAPVRVSTPQVEAPLLVSARGAVLTLLNFQSSTQPPPAIEHLNVTVTLPFAPRSVESIEHGALNFTATQAAVASRGFDRFYSEKQPDAAGLTEIRFAVPLLSFGDLVLLYAPTANGTTTSKSSK
jgi:hypothetical protein